jgi:hypothetical protein
MHRATLGQLSKRGILGLWIRLSGFESLPPSQMLSMSYGQPLDCPFNMRHYRSLRDLEKKLVTLHPKAQKQLAGHRNPAP